MVDVYGLDLYVVVDGDGLSGAEGAEDSWYRWFTVVLSVEGSFFVVDDFVFNVSAALFVDCFEDGFAGSAAVYRYMFVEE